MKYLGIDYGEKRIGIAISDELGLFAMTLPYVKNINHTRSIGEIVSLIRKEGVGKIVMGVPESDRPQDLKQVNVIRSFAKKLERQSRKEIIFWNESFSTEEAKRLLIRKRKKSQMASLIDSESARIILQSYLKYMQEER